MGSDDHSLPRRTVVGGLAATAVSWNVGCGSQSSQEQAPLTPPPTLGAGERRLGRTGASVAPVSLGGEGVLRTTGENRTGIDMVEAALEAGASYCDTAPAYGDSQDYSGAAFRNAGQGARDRVFLATKTHLRDRDQSLRLLDESLERLGTDRVDLWQLHDVRNVETLDTIFGNRGAIQAMRAARDDGRVRHLGITGHFDPRVLVEALRRFDFDSVLVPINPADPLRKPFLPTVVAEARRRDVAVIGMKVFAKGRVLRAGVATPEECLRYATAFADTCIVGCDTATQARSNLALGARIQPMNAEERTALEARFAAHAGRFDYFKG
ncbi:MAG: aldo/keto reductase [Myxococcota bacterium]